MKYKLTKEAIEELKSMEFDHPTLVVGSWTKADEMFDLEPIAEKLPKPSLKSVEDFKALEGWEYQWEHNSPVRWWMPRNTPCNYLGELYTAKIRQIDMPENEYLSQGLH